MCIFVFMIHCVAIAVIYLSGFRLYFFVTEWAQLLPSFRSFFKPWATLHLFFVLIFALVIIIIIILIIFFRRIFSECIEAITTSLIPLETILPEDFPFIIGFICSVWTKMRSLMAPELMCNGWHHFYSSQPTDIAHQYNEGKGLLKQYGQ